MDGLASLLSEKNSAKGNSEETCSVTLTSTRDKFATGLFLFVLFFQLSFLIF